MPRKKAPGPERVKQIFVRVTEKEHRLASALAVRLGTTVQSAFVQMLTEACKALNVTASDVVSENQLALAFGRKPQPLRGVSRRGRGATRQGRGKRPKAKKVQKRKSKKRAPKAKPPTQVAA